MRELLKKELERLYRPIFCKSKESPDGYHEFQDAGKCRRYHGKSGFPPHQIRRCKYCGYKACCKDTIQQGTRYFGGGYWY